VHAVDPPRPGALDDFYASDVSISAPCTTSSPATACPARPARRCRPTPFGAIDDRPVLHPYLARRYAKSIDHEVALRDAIGKVAAEEVEVYPPGIP
jgi:arginine/lysine/ornithine decarboxylase